MNKERVVYLVTGPIGAGKSTYAKCLIEYFGLSSLEYISADIYYLLYFKGNAPNEGEDYANAKQYGYYKLNKAISEQRSFIWETVVAKEKKIKILRTILAQGYMIKCLYIGVRSADIAVSRVAHRHNLGWYSVPESKTIDRYRKSMGYLYELFQLSDSMIIIDGTNEEGKVVLWKESGKIQYLDACCDWVLNLTINEKESRNDEYKNDCT